MIESQDDLDGRGDTESPSPTEIGALDPATRRADGMPLGKPFQRGQTANPRGRPKGLRGAVQRLIGVDGGKALRALYATATNSANGERVRLQAWELLLAYGFGKPQTNVALDGTLDTTVRSVVFGGRFRVDGDLQADRVETRPMPRSVDRSAMRAVDTDDDDDIRPEASPRPAGALPVASAPAPEPEPDDPAESAWTVVEP